jgi:hypothetical protein
MQMVMVDVLFFKKDNSEVATNYRPVTILNISLKFFEVLFMISFPFILNSDCIHNSTNFLNLLWLIKSPV